MRDLAIAATTCMWALVAPTADAQSDAGAIDEIRDELKQVLRDASVGAGYAALINFAMNPAISVAYYYVDSDSPTIDDPVLDVYRFPVRYKVDLGVDDWSGFIQPEAFYQTYDIEDRWAEAERINSRYSATGGSVTMGGEYRVTDSLRVIPALTGGGARLTNDTEYAGFLSETILQPALDGLLYNWSSNSYVLGASVATDYRRDFLGYDLKLESNLSHNYVRAFSTSDDVEPFSGSTTTFDVELETRFLLRNKVFGYPTSLVTMVGNTTFVGPERDQLGFSYFFEAGMALEWDFREEEDWYFKGLRLGFEILGGEDVTGWSVLLGYDT